MRRVVIESPLAGDTELNLAYARRALADSLTRGEAPFASHLLYPQVLDDGDPEQRALGIEAGLEWQGIADRVVVYGDHGLSKGMRHGIGNARRLGIPVEFRYIES
jgi:hypothetical protein